MDTQSVLTLMIQVIVMGFISFMVFDFMDGLWGVPMPPASWQPPVIEPATVSATAPEPTPESAPQFEEIPDPWTLQPQSPQHCLGASAVVPFPTLRLLPPAKAQEVQPTRAKRTKAKSSTPRKSDSTTKRQRQSTKSRMKAV